LFTDIYQEAQQARARAWLAAAAAAAKLLKELPLKCFITGMVSNCDMAVK